MIVYKEVKEIAKCVAKMDWLVNKLEEAGFDGDGVEWLTAKFVALDKEDIQRFKDTNGETEEYYVDQWTGYSADDYHGYLYFKTDVPGQYVRVHFDM